MAAPFRHAAKIIPHRAQSPYDWPASFALIRTACAGMEGRIGPPSSATKLTPEAVKDPSQMAEIWVIGQPPLACMILTPKPGKLYPGKLAVGPAGHGSGLARTLASLAESRARSLDVPMLELETRVKLIQNPGLSPPLWPSRDGAQILCRRHAANIHDRHEARLAAKTKRPRFPRAFNTR